jgi:hypothetical protein
MANDYNTHLGHGWNITIGADRGKGAWRWHTKINTHSPAYQRRFQSQLKSTKLRTPGKSGFRVTQLCDITCKKDHPNVTINTVAKNIDDGFATIIKRQIVGVWNSADELCSSQTWMA